MNTNQIRRFWILFVGFCAFSSMVIWGLGVFDFSAPETFAVLSCAYAISGVFMYRYFIENPWALDKWLPSVDSHKGHSGKRS